MRCDMDPIDFQRKPEESPEKDGEVKKVKHDDAPADAALHTNGDTNGHNWLKPNIGEATRVSSGSS